MRNYPEVYDIIMIKILFIKPPGKDIFTGISKTTIIKKTYLQLNFNNKNQNIKIDSTN